MKIVKKLNILTCKKLVLGQEKRFSCKTQTVSI